MDKLIHSFEQKDPVALGRLLKEVENHTSVGIHFLKHYGLKTGKAHIVGITGPPGVGKSTLIGQLCKMWAEKGLEIGVLCIDPTSPFKGGALLGDRIRMQELSKSPNVFIKSLATRGSIGGLADSADDIVQLFDLFGKDRIVVETVGVGQAELDIMDIADTTVLVNVPGLGDALQTLKGGIMEIADIYVINQADRLGADESVRDLKMMVLERNKTDWVPPVLKVVATASEGISELCTTIESHKSELLTTDIWKKKRQERNVKRFERLLESCFTNAVSQLMQSNHEVVNMIEDIKEGKIDPFTASNEIFNKYFKTL